MNKQIKTMGLCLAAAVLLIGMAFVPAVAAADTYSAGGPHFNGTYVAVETDVVLQYDSTRDLVIISPNGTNPALTQAVNVSQFGADDTSIKVVEVDTNVSLADAHNALAAFTNAALQYPNTTATVASDIFGSGKLIYKVTGAESSVTYYNGTGYESTGYAMTVDTDWALEGQEVKIVVVPAQGFGVYDFKLHKGETKTGDLLTPVEDYLVRSADPEDGATTYILTMPKSAVTVEPLLRDQGTTIVTYVFLNADTYVMEIPADFNIKKANVLVDGKMVNITACELIDNHVLKVNMTSEGGYGAVTTIAGDNFIMKNIKNQGALAAYTIGKKAIYENATAFTTITKNGDIVLTTNGISAEDLEDLITAGNMKTELGFTLIGIADKSVLGKYKDKLTFTVEIA